VPPPESVRISTRRRSRRALARAPAGPLRCARWQCSIQGSPAAARWRALPCPPQGRGQRVKTERLLPRRGGLLLPRMRRHDGGIDVHQEQRPVPAWCAVSGQRSGTLPGARYSDKESPSGKRLRDHHGGIAEFPILITRSSRCGRAAAELQRTSDPSPSGSVSQAPRSERRSSS
jgi:hypothetical protein